VRDLDSNFSALPINANCLKNLGLWGDYTYSIQGGYFDMPAGPTLFSSETLRSAVGLVADLRNVPGASVKQCILINDLGISCSEGACELKSSGLAEQSASEVATDFLSRSGCGHLDIQALTERRIRNRGLRRLKKLIAAGGQGTAKLRFTGEPGALTCELSLARGQSLQLFTERGPSTVAKCPLIMGSVYHLMSLDALSMLNGRNPRAIIVVDFCTYEERDRVAAGARVFSELFAPDFAVPVSIVTICCDGSGRNPITFAYGRTPWEIERIA